MQRLTLQTVHKTKLPNCDWLHLHAGNVPVLTGILALFLLRANHINSLFQMSYSKFGPILKTWINHLAYAWINWNTGSCTHLNSKILLPRTFFHMCACSIYMTPKQGNYRLHLRHNQIIAIDMSNNSIFVANYSSTHENRLFRILL